MEKEENEMKIRRKEILFVILYGIGDTITTFIVIIILGAEELNPIVEYLINIHFLCFVFFKTTIIIIIIFLSESEFKYRKDILNIGIILGFFLTVNNTIGIVLLW